MRLTLASFHKLDDRALLPTVILSSVLIWRFSPAALGVTSAILLLLFHKNSRQGSVTKFLRIWLPMSFYWGALSALSMLITGTALERAIQESGLLALRLFSLFLLGAWLSNYSTAQSLSRAVVWYLSRFTGRIGWEIGLALAIMIRSIPSILHTISCAREAAKLRHLSLWQSFLNIFSHCLRQLSLCSDEVALAVTVRHLDSPEPWIDTSPVPVQDGLCSALFALFAVALLFLPF